MTIAPSSQLRCASSFRLLIHLDYSFLEEVAIHFASGDENAQQSDDEIVLAALDGTADEKLTSFALRLVLSDHIGIPQESQPDLLTEARAGVRAKEAQGCQSEGRGFQQAEASSGQGFGKERDDQEESGLN